MLDLRDKLSSIGPPMAAANNDRTADSIESKSPLADARNYRDRRSDKVRDR